MRFTTPLNPRTRALAAEYLLARLEPDTNGGCWLWSRGQNRDGYGAANFGGSTVLAHRLAYEAFTGEGCGDGVVMHRCDVPACCNPDHLRLGTQLDNIADRHRKGRNGNDFTRKGSRHPMSRLTEDDVREIRRRLALGSRQDDLAAAFNISQSSVSLIALGRTWGHVQ